MKFLDDKQAKILLETAQYLKDRLHPLYYIAIHTGLRLSELMGLKWEDINWKHQTLQVRRQVLHRKGGSFTFIKPKSSSGKRTVILGSNAIIILRNQNSSVRVMADSAGDSWTDLDLVFPSMVGTPLTGSNIRRAFRELLRVSRLPKIRFHDLRHTAASLMLNHGIPVLVASKRLGHSKPSITMDVYGHLLPSKQEEAAQLLDNLLS